MYTKGKLSRPIDEATFIKRLENRFQFKLVRQKPGRPPKRSIFSPPFKEKELKMEISTIVYFEEPHIENTEKILKASFERIKAQKISHVVIATSTGATVRKALKVFHGFPVCIVAVTNRPCATMPVACLYEKYVNSREIKENFKKKNMPTFPISLDNETCSEFEKQGIRVYYVPDPIGLGMPNEADSRLALKEKVSFCIPKHLYPLDIDAGADLSMLNILSMGFRVCVGITAIAAQHELIPPGTNVLAIAGTGWAGGGADTALIITADSNPKACLVREIVGMPKNK
jgi:hypothetical protein